MKMNKHCLTLMMSALSLIMLVQEANAAIALDRTRVIFNGDKSSMVVTITNQNKSLPYLAQAWVEDAEGNKIESPLMALPPLQRVEPGAKGQVKIQSMGDAVKLPQDRESLFYFNVREIPPKSSKPNTLQLALQTRVKLFYRPSAIVIEHGTENDAFKKITLTKSGNGYQINNPSTHFVTIVAASATENGKDVSSFKPIMVSPKDNAQMSVNAAELGTHPVLSFINDFGGRPQATFSCNGNTCSVSAVKAG
ncbi:fimbria/pilus periplasmic chaperone [Enterobacter asburiae]|uniref:fimbria/pilus periplasmic chaperone n=1 Tax=Enterobacter asburiae TaxID=61645 RepID=UPI002148671A|nr:fimbria/pilus periplasmic chaperone [Enterobacter asburiae]UUR72866.1 fimbria/pilus periplasmic chaperone [Enterobacter asburiae]